jgi:Mrp family chromosome partitioning ATPase
MAASTFTHPARQGHRRRAGNLGCWIFSLALDAELLASRACTAPTDTTVPDDAGTKPRKCGWLYDDVGDKLVIQSHGQLGRDGRSRPRPAPAARWLQRQTCSPYTVKDSRISWQKIIVVTSGKGGVGKTTTNASLPPAWHCAGTKPL